MDSDMRHSQVQVKHITMPGKIVDLPTVMESVKAIDGKSMYKTADISQMMVCNRWSDPLEEEVQQKPKKKDPNKVDKKFLWPHGITPPSKNVRRRRFRKTLRKKYAEAPEIEKEVKRLLRSDNEATGIKWEVYNEEDETKINTKGSIIIKREPIDLHGPNVGEHDIFGSAVSESEDEEAHLNVLDIDDNSADSLLTDSNSILNTSNDKLLTEFSSDMFLGMQNLQMVDYYQPQPPPSVIYTPKPLNKTTIEQRLEELDVDLNELKSKLHQEESKIETIENIALRQRFKDSVERLLDEQSSKERERFGLLELLRDFFED